MSCQGYLVKKCWFPPTKNAALCKSCQLIKDKESLNQILNNPYDRKITESYLYSRGHASMIQVQDTFDTIANFLYRNDKQLLDQYICSNKALFSKRVYTHNDTQLCDVVGFILRKTPEVPVPGCCLQCMAHTMRYTDDEYLINLILRAVVIRYADCPNIESMIRKTQGRIPLYEFGAAILEKQGASGVFEDYTKLLTKWKPDEAHDVIGLLIIHPVLHKCILETNSEESICKTQRQMLYDFFKSKKDIFYQELIAKSMHPSRVFHWCLDNDDTIDISSQLKPYQFNQGKAEWNINW